ncbi:MAG: exo-beta-N-acetylmuramidase NamZ domain-containing protein [Muribaculaceae bacterium]
MHNFFKTSLIVMMALIAIPAIAKKAKCDTPASGEIIVGAACTSEYVPLLKGKKVALLSNHTGVVGDKHVLDIMLEKGVDVTTIFSPEHGFRGNADAGEHVKSSVDEKTGIPIASLYDGNSKKPAKKVMDGFDVLVVDIQDVGLRFYTYYVTMINLMNAAIEYDKEVVVFDRPNPNGMYVDGPILDMKYKSGVGALPIPVVHGLTMGEIANMANGEGWLENGKKVKLTVIKCKNYTHQSRYVLPVAPSPNLPNMHSIYLYPSTCYFEATPVSLGRGTDKPFQVYGHPNMKGYDFSFTPRSIPGAKNPPQLDRECYGRDLTQIPDDEIIAKGINLEYVIDAYRNLNLDDHFFRSFFELLIGNGKVRKMIKEGKSADEIKATWSEDLARFKEQRRPYLLYAE